MKSTMYLLSIWINPKQQHYHVEDSLANILLYLAKVNQIFWIRAKFDNLPHRIMSEVTCIDRDNTINFRVSYSQDGCSLRHIRDYAEKDNVDGKYNSLLEMIQSFYAKDSSWGYTQQCAQTLILEVLGDDEDFLASLPLGILGPIKAK